MLRKFIVNITKDEVGNTFGFVFLDKYHKDGRTYIKLANAERNLTSSLEKIGKMTDAEKLAEVEKLIEAEKLPEDITQQFSLDEILINLEIDKFLEQVKRNGLLENPEIICSMFDYDHEEEVLDILCNGKEIVVMDYERLMKLKKNPKRITRDGTRFTDKDGNISTYKVYIIDPSKRYSVNKKATAELFA